MSKSPLGHVHYPYRVECSLERSSPPVRRSPPGATIGTALRAGLDQARLRAADVTEVVDHCVDLGAAQRLHGRVVLLFSPGRVQLLLCSVDRFDQCRWIDARLDGRLQPSQPPFDLGDGLGCRIPPRCGAAQPPGPTSHPTSGRQRIRIGVARAVTQRSGRSCAIRTLPGGRLWSHHGIAPAAKRARRFVMKPWRAAANPCRSSRMSALISISSSRRWSRSGLRCSSVARRSRFPARSSG